MGDKLKHDYNVLDSEIDITWDDNKKIHVDGSIEKIDLAYYRCGYRVWKSVYNNGIIIRAYRGNLVGYEDITGQWKQYRKIILSGKLPK